MDVVDDTGWTDANSETFIRLGDVLVPDRETQLDAICALVPDSPGVIVELSCGEGLLAERLLERFSDSRLIALDASPPMLARAAARLARFGERQEVRCNPYVSITVESISSFTTRTAGPAPLPRPADGGPPAPRRAGGRGQR